MRTVVRKLDSHGVLAHKKVLSGEQSTTTEQLVGCSLAKETKQQSTVQVTSRPWVQRPKDQENQVV